MQLIFVSWFTFLLFWWIYWARFCVIFWELYIYDHVIFKQIIRLFPFQFGCFLFVFLDVLLWLELLLHYWIEVAKFVIFVLFLNLEKHQPYTIEYGVAVGAFSYIFLLCWGSFFLFLVGIFFIIKWYCVLSNPFSASIEMIMWFFLFIFNVAYHTG